MSAALTLPITVTVQRHALDQLWPGHRWQASSAAIARGYASDTKRTGRHTIDPSPISAFVESSIALPASLTLHRSEVPAYLINLVTGSPVLFVAIEETDTSVVMKGLTASPLALDPYDRPGIVTVDRVPMPREIIDAIRSFVDSLGWTTGRATSPLRPAF